MSLKTQLNNLQDFFSETMLADMSKYHLGYISILSYFATSLFDKKTKDDVLWDIAEKCISQLGLEDCVIYERDKTGTFLKQKAAFGNKSLDNRKILSPIEIPLGQGIVGSVAQNGTPEIVANTKKDKRYILDDAQRLSELSVPIFVNNNVFGVIDSEHSSANFFTQEHLRLFLLIATLTSKKIEAVQANAKKTITQQNPYYKELQRLLTEEKFFKDPKVNLTKVAERLGISSNYLSQVIGSCCKRSFSEMINICRIEEAIRLLSDTKFNHYSLSGIGVESGFANSSSFFKAFKRIKGLSPKAWMADKRIADY